MTDFLKSAVFEHRFWLQVLRDHSRFICDSLYPSQIKDIERASYFVETFNVYLSKVDSLDEMSIITFSSNVMPYVQQLKDFKLSIIQRHLLSEMKIHLSPTFLNHMVNELEEYELILSHLKKGEIPPIFHELHHHLIWLKDASTHADDIYKKLDNVETRLKEESYEFTKHFRQFYLKAEELAGYLRTKTPRFPALTKFNEAVEVEIQIFKGFLLELEELEIGAEVLGTFTISMVDHMAREAEYYLTKLMESETLHL